MTNQELIAKRKALLRKAQGLKDSPGKAVLLAKADEYLKQLKDVTEEDAYGFLVH